MPDFALTNYRWKSGFVSSRNFILPVLAVVLSIGWLTNWQLSAKENIEAQPSRTEQLIAAQNSTQKAFLSPANCGDGWDNRFASGANGDVLAVAADAGGNIYIGGNFTQVGGVAANHIAKWNGLTWSALGSGTDDYVNAIAISGSNVYAGGEFNTAGGAEAKYIAKWNGSSWSALGNGTDANVSSIAVSGGDVYAGGFFENAGNVPAKYIAKWNGSSWSALGSGTSDIVNAVTVAGTDVYAGGFFETAGGVPTNHVAKWNGSNWSALGDGTDGEVYSLAASGNNLYAGGNFFAAGGVSDTSRIAKWDGANWSALGTGANNTIYAIAVSGSNVYASGYFTSVNQAAANRIARWNGSSWSALGSGMNDAAIALAASGSGIYAGGFFSVAGCRGSNKVARYFLQSFSGSSNNDWHTAANWSSGNVPSTDSDVNIGTADTFISTSDAMIRDLRVDEGRTLTIAANRTLVVNGNLNLLGNITGAGTLVVANCSTAAIAREEGAGYVRLSLTRCINNIGAFNFPVGTPNGYSPVRISNVTGNGNFTVKAVQGAYPAAVSGLSTNRLQRFWNLTNGGITSADVQFNYLADDVLGTESDYKIFRINGTTAEAVSGTVNAANHTAIVPGVSNFSPWTLGELVIPTAAATLVSGRVTTATGRGVFGAQVVMINSNGESRYARTNPFGFYSFSEVAAGETYTINVRHKNYAFASRVITVTEDLVGLDFSANPR
jgi:hypothetical protein